MNEGLEYDNMDFFRTNTFPMTNKINIGVDIGASHTALALVNISGSILYKTQFDINNQITSNKLINMLGENIIKLIEKCREYNKVDINNTTMVCNEFLQ